MLNNFTGNNDREIAYKRNPDNSETKFRFDYENDPNTSEEVFLSNLHMTGDLITISTHSNLNWNVKDIVLIGNERTRYQITNVQKVKKPLPKSMYVRKVQWTYVLTLSA